jgi:hypothetical protein
MSSSLQIMTLLVLPILPLPAQRLHIHGIHLLFLPFHHLSLNFQIPHSWYVGQRTWNQLDKPYYLELHYMLLELND